MIIAVCGLPGSGKTFFARRLAKELGGDYYGTDQVRKEILKQIEYSAKTKEKVYAELYQRIAKSENDIIIVDGTFHKQDRRKNSIIWLGI